MKHQFKRVFHSLIVLAHKLGGKNIWGQFSLYAKLLVASVHWKLFGKKTYAFDFVYSGLKFKLLLHDSTDIAALEEIYVEGEYDWELPFVPKFILDLGANYGDTSLYYSAKYPNATIVALEPSEESYKRLCVHTADSDKIIPVNAALSLNDGSQRFYLNPANNLGNSLYQRVEGDPFIEVPTMRLETLVRKYVGSGKFDLIKFDIEGGEEVFAEESNLSAFARAFIGELHYDLIKISKEKMLAAWPDFITEIQNLSSKERVIIRANKED